MRGEDFTIDYIKKMNMETPPHAWRRPALSFCFAISSGNTSTCVEKTLVLIKNNLTVQKHLHMRGEDNLKLPF